MDTKTTLIVLFVVTCILYFSYSTSQAQAEENRSLRRTIDTMRVLMPVRGGVEPQPQRNLDPSENETNFQFPPGASAGPSQSDPPKKSPFPPRESDGDGDGGDASQYGIGAGLETMDPTKPLASSNNAPFPRALPMYA